ncbi:Tau-tubulin kinase 1 [Toxocara canis]|uniref:non-specific serine/threonine protein kinase n=1 Tax=Toxocara canis TaxID=6265 RepID=A0A0B2V2P9_TOXCA|nr:Tau-tubulin kinase 1 [Toxocara canis]
MRRLNEFGDWLILSPAEDRMAKKQQKIIKCEEDLKVYSPEPSDSENEEDDKRKAKLKEDRPKQKSPKGKERKENENRSHVRLAKSFNESRKRYEVLKLLGSGGFGDVYMVRRLRDEKKEVAEKDKKNRKKSQRKEDKDSRKDDELFALKTEKSSVGKDQKRLKVEMAILQICAALPKEKRSHFIEMIDKGRTESFKFIVMELVGRSIDRIQREMPDRNFSLRTSIKLALQTVESIEDLHEIGYIHRDIKPQNFTMGLNKNAETVFLLDFGIARRYTKKDSKAIRLPRKKVIFLGTIRYASRNCHDEKEQCRGDDLESWIYMFLEFIDGRNALPWIRKKDKSAVCTEKRALFDGKYSQSVQSLPEEIHKIIVYVDSLGYVDTPDYAFIRTMLQKAAQRKNIEIKGPLDWHEPDHSNGSNKKQHTASEEDDSLVDLEWIL